MFRLSKKGSVDPMAWMTAIVGFSLTFTLWVFFRPALDALLDTGLNSMPIADPQAAIPRQLLGFVSTVNNYAYIIIGAVWLLYILFSSIKKEVQEYGLMQP